MLEYLGITVNDGYHCIVVDLPYDDTCKFFLCENVAAVGNNGALRIAHVARGVSLIGNLETNATVLSVKRGSCPYTTGRRSLSCLHEFSILLFWCCSAQGVEPSTFRLLEKDPKDETKRIALERKVLYCGWRRCEDDQFLPVGLNFDAIVFLPSQSTVFVR